MRNLKRALSLTLASVMLLGMMVVGSSAAKGYPDVDEEDNVEAIEVLQAVQVMRGDDNGNFNPDSSVTRSEMAVIMALLLNYDYQYYEAACPFWDVPTWARPYVGACYTNKIVSGYGDGTYGAADTVTAVQAASMMMRALGYFQNPEDYADGFETATVRQGSQIGIFEGVGSSATAPLTRNQVAQMALNALRSEMVTFTGTPGVTVGDATIGYRAEYTPRTSTEAKYNAIESRTSDVATEANHKGQYYIQLGEELYNGKLRLNSTTDAFERPARHWEFDGVTIGTYVKEELLRQEWTEEVTGKMLYDVLTKPTIDNYDFTIAVDGETVKSNLTLAGGVTAYFDKTYLNNNHKVGVGRTGNGVLTQVFVDANNEQVYIAVINTYLAKATGDYNTNRETVAYDVFGVVNNGGTSSNPILVKKTDGTTANKTTITVSADDFDIAEVKKNDIVLVNVAKGTIQIMMAPEVIASTTLSAFAKGDYVVNEGTTVKYNDAAEYDVEVLDVFTGANGVTNLRDKHYNLYLDKNGFMVGIEVVEEDNNYIFLTGIDRGLSDLTNKTADAAGILTDGTFVNIKVDMDKSKRWNNVTGAWDTAFSGGSMLNTWCTYSVNSSNVYTLREVGTSSAMTAAGSKVKVAQWHDSNYFNIAGKQDINSKNYTLPGDNSGSYRWAYGNENSVYMTAKVANIAARSTMFNVPTLTSSNQAAEIAQVNSQDRVAIINGVDTRSVGIANTDMTLWNAATIAAKAGTTPPLQSYTGTLADGTTASVNAIPSGVYTLYNKDTYVIASIVIGEDNGLSSDIVYVNSADAKEERFEPAGSESRATTTEGEWVWGREVVNLSTKEITKIYEQGDALEIIGNAVSNEGKLYQGGVFQLKFNGNGMVIAANEITLDQYGNNTVDSVTYVRTIEGLEYSISTGKDTVVLNTGSKTNNPTLEGSTLHLDGANDRGFLVDSDVFTVFIQTNGGKTTTVPYEGTSGLSTVLGTLNKRTNGGVQYRITALILKSKAVAIVITDEVVDGAAINGSWTFDKDTVVEWDLFNPGQINVTTTQRATNANIEQWVRYLLNDSNIARVLYNSQSRTVSVYYSDIFWPDTYDMVINAGQRQVVVAGAQYVNDAMKKWDPSVTENIEYESNTVKVPDTTVDRANNKLAEFLEALHQAGCVNIDFLGYRYNWSNTAYSTGGAWMRTGAAPKAYLSADLMYAVAEYMNANQKTFTEGGQTAGVTAQATLTVDSSEIVMIREVRNAQATATVSFLETIQREYDANNGTGKMVFGGTDTDITVTTNAPATGEWAGLAYVTDPGESDTTEATKDLSKFLNGVKEAGAVKITYNGKDYTWDENHNTSNKWVTGSDTKTSLVSAMVSEFASQINGNNDATIIATAKPLTVVTGTGSDAVTRSIVITLSIAGWQENEQAYVEVNGQRTYGTLAELLENAEVGSVITLQDDVTEVTESLAIASNITLNLNGNEISGGIQSGSIVKVTARNATILGNGGSITNTIDGDAGKNPHAIHVAGGAGLTISNTNITGSCGVMVGYDTSAGQSDSRTPSELTMTGCTVTDTGKTSNSNAAISSNGKDRSGMVITIRNSEIIGGNVEGIYLPGAGNVTLDNTKVSGISGIGIKSGTLNIRNGSVISGTAVGATGSTAGNGIVSDGSAIYIVSDNAYAGQMKINASNSTLSSKDANAIADARASNAQNILSIDLSGCTLSSGEGKVKLGLNMQAGDQKPVITIAKADAETADDVKALFKADAPITVTEDASKGVWTVTVTAAEG